jgi:hypothetical protein
VTDGPSDNLLLWQFDPLTFYYCDRWTQWQFTTVALWPLNILLLWQMDPVTFYYCDTLPPPIRYIQVTNVHPPLKVGYFVTVIGHSHFFPGLWQDIHFGSKAKCGHYVTGHGDHLEAFDLVSRGVDKMSQWSKLSRGKLLKVAIASKRAVGLEK